MSQGRRRRIGGFTLAETVVALALAALALLFTLVLLAQEPRAARRMAAHREATAALEVALESLRAGLALPTDGSVFAPEAWTRPDLARAEDLQLRIEATPRSPPGLTAIRVAARYRVRGQWFERAVETELWRPP